MRFRRRIKIAPGLGLNLSGSGLGLSTGLPGLSVSVGKRGIWGYASLPGTGFYQRKRLSNSALTASDSLRKSRNEQEAELLDRFTSCNPLLTAPLAGGPVALVDGTGLPLPPEVQETAWKHLRDELLEQLAARCEEISADIQSLATLHHSTPPPTPPLLYARTPFELPAPEPLVPESYHWLWKFLPWHRRRVDSGNDQQDSVFQVEYREWLDARAAYDRLESERQSRFKLRDELKAFDI